MTSGLSVDRRSVFPVGSRRRKAETADGIQLGSSVEAHDQPVLAGNIADRYALSTGPFTLESTPKSHSVGTMLIDSRFLFREGLKIILRQSCYSVVAEADDIASALVFMGCSSAPQLILYGLHFADADLIQSLKALREACVGSRVVIQADPAVDPALIQRSFDIGVDAWIKMDALPGVLKRSLDLVMLGERVLPTKTIMTYVAERNSVGFASGAFPKCVFSRHEKEILRHLVMGHSNKMIARQLDLADSTVKMLLKALFRKIGVVNRTQAAIWANCERAGTD